MFHRRISEKKVASMLPLTCCTKLQVCAQAPTTTLESKVVRIIVGSCFFFFFFQLALKCCTDQVCEISGKTHVWCHEATRRYGAAARFS